MLFAIFLYTFTILSMRVMELLFRSSIQIKWSFKCWLSCVLNIDLKVNCWRLSVWLLVLWGSNRCIIVLVGVLKFFGCMLDLNICNWMVRWVNEVVTTGKLNWLLCLLLLRLLVITENMGLITWRRIFSHITLSFSFLVIHITALFRLSLSTVYTAWRTPGPSFLQSH